MILVGSQRGGASNLAAHLLKDENEHVEVHEIRGFASENLKGALNEAYAMSRGTRAKQFLFSLSLNPPPEERVETGVFEDAIARAEEKLGLSGQPRAIVFHEKEGRRHAHAVWSRIDATEMKAISISYSKLRLRDVSRELYLEHGWKMPRGLINSQERDPKNFTLAEWQQAKRIGKDPRAIKTDFQDCWAVSDSKAAFVQALQERGYKLGRGDRRGFVAVDHQGREFAVAKWAGVKTRQVRERLGNEKELPALAEVKQQFAEDMIPALQRMKRSQGNEYSRRKEQFEVQRLELVSNQQAERQHFMHAQERRQQAEAIERQSRFRTGLKGFWDKLRGEHSRIQQQNQGEAYQALMRDRQEKDALIFRQLEQRNALQQTRTQNLEEFIQQRRDLRSDLRQYKAMQPESREDRRAAYIREQQTQQAHDIPRNRGPGLTRDR